MIHAWRPSSRLCARQAEPAARPCLKKKGRLARRRPWRQGIGSPVGQVCRRMSDRGDLPATCHLYAPPGRSDHSPVQYLRKYFPLAVRATCFPAALRQCSPIRERPGLHASFVPLGSGSTGPGRNGSANHKAASPPVQPRPGHRDDFGLWGLSWNSPSVRSCSSLQYFCLPFWREFPRSTQVRQSCAVKSCRRCSPFSSPPALRSV